MSKRIFIKDWLELKPYEKQTVTDSYYLRISNEAKKAIEADKSSAFLYMFMYKEDLNLLSCFLTSYLEDIISGTNIWNSFIKAHHRMYGKHLPFYDLDDYFEGEINPQDIAFLIWYFLNTIQEEKFVSPYNEFIFHIAHSLYDVFDSEWEYAPENEHLKSQYHIDENEDNFYFARLLIEKTLYGTYLFYPDTFLKLHGQMLQIMEETKENEHLMMFLNDCKDGNLFRNTTRLLSFKGKEWVSEILPDNHPLKKEFVQISDKILGYFFYKGQDKDNVHIEHIASGKKFDLTKKSFDYSDTLVEVDTILFLGIARWKNEWWFSGIFFDQPFNADLVLDEKNSLESRRAVDFLDRDEQITKDILKQQFEAFLDFNNGRQIAFLSSDELNDFQVGYADFYNKSLNLSKKQIKEAEKRKEKSGFLGSNNDTIDFSKEADSVLVFFNPKSGVEICININSAFPMPHNPYFREEDSNTHVMNLLMDNSISTELTMFCIENCKSRLPFFTEGDGQKYLDDFDFLLRFWKNENYRSVPSITLMG